MSINFSINDPDGIFTKDKERIINQYHKAIEKVTALMPVDNIDVVFKYGGSDVIIPEVGIGCSLQDAHNVHVCLDPNLDTYEYALEEEIERVIAHEFHHSKRDQGPGYGTTLFEGLVSEGLADHFDLEVSGKGIHFWCQALTPEQSAEFWEKSKKYFWTKYDDIAWFYGSEEAGIPRCTGYTLAFQLIEKYFKKYPELKASQLYDKSAKEIYEEMEL